MTARVEDDDDMDRRQVMRRTTDAINTDGVPWQVKAAVMLGVPSVIALYLVYALVSGIVPAILSMQTTMSNLVAAQGTIAADHQAAKQQNEQILRVLRAGCVNAAMDNQQRERCLQ